MEFEPSSRLEIGNGGVRAKFGRLESEMEEFEPSSDFWNRKWRSSKLEYGNGSDSTILLFNSNTYVTMKIY